MPNSRCFINEPRGCINAPRCFSSRFRLLLLLCGILCIGGCHSTWLWGDAEDSAEDREDAAALSHRALVQNNLDRGLLALQTDRLTLPREDCAVFYYRKVLAVEPDNSEASNGLDKVVNRYLNLAQQAHDNGNDKQASSWVKRAEEVRGPTKKSEALRAKLKKTPKGQHNREIAYLPANDYLLSREALDERGTEITKKLADIARKAESRQRAALVVARTEEEGQWIAKILQATVPTYPLRTKIQLASRPAVILMSDKELAETARQDAKLVETLGSDKQALEKQLRKSGKQLPVPQKKSGSQAQGGSRE